MITINDIKTTLRASSKGFNKDLFLNDSEVVEINEISKQKEEALFWLNGESTPIFDNKGEIIKQNKNYICISTDGNKKVAFYSINSSISKYNNEIQKNYFRKQLTSKGLLWLVNKSNSTDDKTLSMIYNLVLLNEDISVNFDDLLTLAVIKPSGTRIVEFETYNHIISIIINKENKLVDINKKVIATNKREFSFDDGLDSSDTFEPEKEVINNSFFDDEL